MTGVYRVGGHLYEGAHRVVAGRRVPCVRKWDILSVVADPEWQDVNGQPLQVVTLRTHVNGTPKYMAENTESLDLDVDHNVWRRTRKAAEAMIATWAGYQPKKPRLRRTRS